MYIITAPTLYNGVGYGLSFVNGVAKTDNDITAKLLKQKGYLVEKVEPNEKGEFGVHISTEGITTSEDLTPTALETMDIDQLTEYAKLKKIDIGRATSQVTILERIKNAANNVVSDEITSSNRTED